MHNSSPTTDVLEPPSSEKPNSLLPLSHLNAPQRAAVEALDGPVLVLAGAGTGKTRVLTTRIANILAQNKAYPSQILAVTFTNKAAAEMRERVESLAPGNAGGMWLGTFHSIGLRILRSHAELIGLQPNFSILDEDDQLRLIKRIIAEQNIDEKRWPPRAFHSLIQSLKDRGLTPDDAKDTDTSHFANGKLLTVYSAYQHRLKVLNAADFGDLLLHCVTLFKRHPDVLATYQRKFRFVLVDEYQDTNIVQYLFLRLLAMGHHNLCCVGDDDQSIYGWRGAEVGNILKFEKDFPGAAVIRLEQNYRSTKDILGAAAAIISHNKGRLGKTLWTDQPDSSKVRVVSVWDEKEEARYVAGEIESLQQLHKISPKDIAILVRTGALTRAFEECFTSLGIPYRIIGGLRFYERMEIRDAIAYFRLTAQHQDDMALERIINNPKRGVGKATLEQIRAVALGRNISMFQALNTMLAEGTIRGKMQDTLRHFVESFARWRLRLEESPPAALAETILIESGYMEMWNNDKTPEAEGRVENLKELLAALEEFESLPAFLEHISLVMDSDSIDDSNMVRIMTLHAAKGLEFDTVFLPGWEEGLFPHQKRMDEEGTSGIEEERRLAYVGITRAKQRLTISHAANRRIFNQWQTATPSRFLKELPEEHTENLHTGSNFRASTGGDASALFEAVKQRALTGFYASGSNGFIPQSGSNPSGFSPGERVFHQKFGYGRVTRVDGEHLDIHFEKSSPRTILADFVKKA